MAEDVETRFDTPDFKIERPLPKGKIKRVRRTNHERICWIKSKSIKAYSYLKHNNDDDEKSKRHKKVPHEKK